MIRLADVKASSAINIAGVSPNSSEFVRLINEATRRLMRRGDWEGLIQPIQVCITAGCVVWPRYVKAVRKLNLCKSGIPINNVWYDFLPYNRGRMQDNFWYAWLDQPGHMTFKMRTPVFQDIQGDGRTVRAYTSTPLDNNRTIRIFGEDTNGQRLQTQGIGGWKDGITLTLQTPYVESTVQVRRIDRVIKDTTQGPVRLYAWNTATSLLEDLALYASDETNPSYERTQISLTNCCCDSQSVVALIKLAFVPVVNDDDWVLVDNLDAIKNMIRSIKCEEADDDPGKEKNEKAAIRELNLDISDQTMDEQIPVSFGAFADTGLGLRKCF